MPSNLFERGFLQQDTGLLQERWGQSGSNIVTIGDGANSDETLYTVTSGKKYYVKSLSTTTNVAGGSFNLHDGGALGTVKYTQQMSATLVGDSVSVTFDTPIVFETDVYINLTSANLKINMTGWEE